MSCGVAQAHTACVAKLDRRHLRLGRARRGTVFLPLLGRKINPLSSMKASHPIGRSLRWLSTVQPQPVPLADPASPPAMSALAESLEELAATPLLGCALLELWVDVEGSDDVAAVDEGEGARLEETVEESCADVDGADAAPLEEEEMDAAALEATVNDAAELLDVPATLDPLPTVELDCEEVPLEAEMSLPLVVPPIMELEMALDPGSAEDAELDDLVITVVHNAEQLSPLTPLLRPSSHCSPPLMTPSPQRGPSPAHKVPQWL